MVEGKGLELKKYLEEKEKREKFLLKIYHECSNQLWDLFRCGEITKEEYNECQKKYQQSIKESEEAYKQFLIDLNKKE